jgi:predicted restriction endonuclease
MPMRLFNALASLIGTEVQQAIQIAKNVARMPGANRAPAEDVVVWEEHLRQELERDISINETEREAIVLARRGQGLFRRRVSELEARCRVTRVSEPEHLRASHCKPWRDSSNEERLDGENGLLLTPSIDHLFDRGFISFEDNGRLLISPVAHNASLQKMGVKTEEKVVVGGFSDGQRKYLEYHRESVFLQAKYRR